MFQQPRSGVLTEQKEELETHLRKTYSDPEREKTLEDIEGLVWPSASGVKFNNKPPTLHEVNSLVKKARRKSSHWPNGVPDLLYKKCPNVLRWLHKMLRSVWNNLKISEQWMTTKEFTFLRADLN
ncbi:polyprotein [Plakobranchus ocellatus]|uniref:Polyprotein n=1 Tax=Plakobranchus ocellatus TaxID=259542 RepID=A0AAV3YBV7_9GAST|nr:polyprotein [Plakobranchus ocellatus]